MSWVRMLRRELVLGWMTPSPLKMIWVKMLRRELVLGWTTPSSIQFLLLSMGVGGDDSIFHSIPFVVSGKFFFSFLWDPCFVYASVVYSYGCQLKNYRGAIQPLHSNLEKKAKFLQFKLGVWSILKGTELCIFLCFKIDGYNLVLHFFIVLNV
ncbi:hypothetical protein NMG60_11035983 [Bertholletia excelsa]